MADPLSIAASVGGVLSISSAILISLSTLTGSVREAPQSVSLLHAEIRSLCTILQQLENNLRGDLSTAPRAIFDGLNEVLKNCKEVKEEIMKIISPYVASLQKGNGITKTWWKVKWVMVVEKDIDKFRRTLEVHKSTLGLTVMLISKYVTEDMSGDVVRILSSMGIMNSTVGDVRERIQELVEALKTQPGIRVSDGAGGARGGGEGASIDMVRRYLESAASYVETMSHIDEESDAGGVLAEYRAGTPAVPVPHGRLDDHDRDHHLGRQYSTRSTRSTLAPWSPPPGSTTGTVGAPTPRPSGVSRSYTVGSATGHGYGHGLPRGRPDPGSSRQLLLGTRLPPSGTMGLSKGWVPEDNFSQPPLSRSYSQQHPAPNVHVHARPSFDRHNATWHSSRSSSIDVSSTIGDSAAGGRHYSFPSSPYTQTLPAPPIPPLGPRTPPPPPPPPYPTEPEASSTPYPADGEWYDQLLWSRIQTAEIESSLQRPQAPVPFNNGQYRQDRQDSTIPSHRGGHVMSGPDYSPSHAIQESLDPNHPSYHRAPPTENDKLLHYEIGLDGSKLLLMPPYPPSRPQTPPQEYTEYAYDPFLILDSTQVAISLSRTLSTDLPSARTSDSKSRLLAEIKDAITYFSTLMHSLHYLVTLEFCPRPLSTLRLPLQLQTDLSKITSAYIDTMIQLNTIVESCTITPERSAGLKGVLFVKKPKLEDDEWEIRKLLKTLEDQGWALKVMNDTIVELLPNAESAGEDEIDEDFEFEYNQDYNTEYQYANDSGNFPSFARPQPQSGEGGRGSLHNLNHNHNSYHTPRGMGTDQLAERLSGSLVLS